MGLLKKIVSVAKTAVRLPVAAIAATSAGMTTGVVARLKPAVLGIKSDAARSVVSTSQAVLGGVAVAAVGGSGLKTVVPAPARPAAAAPVDANLEALNELFIRHLLKG